MKSRGAKYKFWYQKHRSGTKETHWLGIIDLHPIAVFFFFDTFGVVGLKNPLFICKKLWYFDSNSVKTTLSGNCGGSFQRHVGTEFQKICFHLAQDQIFSVVKQKMF